MGDAPWLDGDWEDPFEDLYVGPTYPVSELDADLEAAWDDIATDYQRGVY